MLTRIIPLALVAACLTLVAPTDAQARKKKTPPKLALKVLKGKKVIGKEALRIKTGKKDEAGVTKFYLSTKSRLKDSGRTFGFRTHTVLDQKGRLLTYDRWIDVKGATLRRRIFAFKGDWKMVVFAQSRGRKNELTELKIKGPLLVLDPRSPALVSMAVDRMTGKGEMHFVNANTGKTGKVTLSAEYLVDANGKRYTRHHLKGDGVAVSALRDDKGNTLQVKGLGKYAGSVATFKPGALQPATPAAGAAAPVDQDAPIAPPGTGKPAAKPSSAADPKPVKPAAEKPAPVKPAKK